VNATSSSSQSDKEKQPPPPRDGTQKDSCDIVDALIHNNAITFIFVLFSYAVLPSSEK
jgi:hypothetical protein